MEPHGAPELIYGFIFPTCFIYKKQNDQPNDALYSQNMLV